MKKNYTSFKPYIFFIFIRIHCYDNNSNIMKEASLSSPDASFVKIDIHIYPGDERLTYYFDNNKSFLELKKKLIEQHVLTKETYYFEMNGKILNEDVIIKESGINENSCTNIIRNDYANVVIEIKESKDMLPIIQSYMPISDFKIIKPNRNKRIEVCNNIFFPPHNLSYCYYISKERRNKECNKSSGIRIIRPFICLRRFKFAL